MNKKEALRKVLSAVDTVGITQIDKPNRWHYLKAAICIILGKYRDGHGDYCIPDIPLCTWGYGQCPIEGYFNWQEISVDKGWKHWNVWLYSNGT